MGKPHRPKGQAMPVIQPTVGRVVHFYGSAFDTIDPPFAAMITHVHDARLVNLVVFNRQGIPFGAMDVKLRQPGDEEEPGGDRCQWPPAVLAMADRKK